MSILNPNNILFEDDYPGYRLAYFSQAVPGLGAVVSIPTALISAGHAICKLAQAVFERYYHKNPWFTDPSSQVDFALNSNARKCTPLEDAGKLGVIFANNLLNLCTLGILNNVQVIRMFCALSSGMRAAQGAG